MLPILPKGQIETISAVALILLSLSAAVTAAPAPWKVTEFEIEPNQLEPTLRVWTRDTIPVPLQPATMHDVPIDEMDFHAFIADWDTDVALDGLLVRVSPFDANGELIELNGRLEVALQIRRVCGSTENKKIAPKSTIARWICDLSRTHRKTLAYECRLPLENDVHDDPRELYQYFVMVHLDTAGRSYRKLQQLRRIVLTGQDIAAVEQPVIPAASLPGYVKQTPHQPR